MGAGAPVIICPACGTPVPNESLIGEQVSGVYDGVLIWHDERCGHMWPRFDPDPASGYRRLHDAAMRLIASRQTAGP